MSPSKLILATTLLAAAAPACYAIDLYTGIEGGVNYLGLEQIMQSSNPNIKLTDNHKKPMTQGASAGIFTGISQGLGPYSIGAELGADMYTGQANTQLTSNGVSFSSHDKLRYSLDASILPQFSIMPMTRLFLRGGIVYGHFTGTTNVNNGADNNYTINDLGYKLGAGLGVQFSEHWSARAEYNYTIFNEIGRASCRERV